MNEKNSREYAKMIADEIEAVLDSKKAYDVNVLHVGKQTVLADYFVLANGTSSTHIKALADETELKIREKLDLNPARIEGERNKSWMLLDYGMVVVHIFTAEARDFYKLDKLWAEPGVVNPLK